MADLAPVALFILLFAVPLFGISAALPFTGLFLDLPKRRRYQRLLVYLGSFLLFVAFMIYLLETYGVMSVLIVPILLFGFVLIAKSRT